jgi:hypothetical protein
LTPGGKAVVWWDALPAGLGKPTLPSGEDGHLLHASDCVGPQSRQKRHPQNYGL